MCVFCQISTGDMPAEIVLERDGCLGFLDRRPLFPGHVLVIPRDHVQTLPELPGEMLQPLFAAVQLMSKAVPHAMGAAGSFVAVNNKVSQSVAHLHVHVVPRNPKDGLKGFFWPRRGYRDERHMAEVGALIRQALETS